MIGSSTVTSSEVLEFWLGPSAERGQPSGSVQGRWWKKSDSFDAEIEQRFGDTISHVGAGDIDWGSSALGVLGMVIVLDQFTRNTRRGTGLMYEFDVQAHQFTLAALDVGQDTALAFAERYFLYMPLMHAEDLASQDRGIACFTKLAGEAPHFAGAVKFAHRHRDIVARFGRFPHRNELLARESTAREIEFLKEPGSSF